MWMKLEKQYFLAKSIQIECIWLSARNFFLLPNSNQFVSPLPFPTGVLKGPSSRAFKTILGPLSSFARKPLESFFRCQPSISFFKTTFFLILSLQTKKTEQRKMSDAERLDQISLGSESSRGCRGYSEMLVLCKISSCSIKYIVLVILRKEHWHRYDPSFSRPLQHKGYV